MHLAYVAPAATPAANLIDLVLSASGHLRRPVGGPTGAIATEIEIQALRWLADMAGFPDGSGGCLVSGGSAANLSALVTAHHHPREDRGHPGRREVAFRHDGRTQASMHAAARVMDVDIVLVPPDARGA